MATDSMTKPSRASLDALTRGTVVIVQFEPAMGSEQTKRRPAVIVSCDTLNRKLRTLVVVPISGLEDETGKKRDPYLHEVELASGAGGLKFRSAAQPIQIRTIDRDHRVTEILGQLPPEVMVNISIKLVIVLGGAGVALP